MGAVGSVLAGSLALPARVPAQVSVAEEAQAYIDSHADIEDMVMVPMRDGVRLYHLILFPKGAAAAEHADGDDPDPVSDRRAPHR